jgi:hypothetical protein
MNTYNALAYYYDPTYLESVLTKDILTPANRHTLQARGGWSEGVGYDDAYDVNAVHYHYLSHSMESHVLERETRECLEGLIIWTNMRAKQLLPSGFRVGEICIRTIWYEAHPEYRVLGHHVDFDFLTIPLYDSTSSRCAEPFFGQLAQDMKAAKAKKHGFVVKTEPRLYVVAFVQLPMDTILPNGQRYGDRVSQLVGRADSNHTREY